MSKLFRCKIWFTPAHPFLSFDLKAKWRKQRCNPGLTSSPNENFTAFPKLFSLICASHRIQVYENLSSLCLQWSSLRNIVHCLCVFWHVFKAASFSLQTIANRERQKEWSALFPKQNQLTNPVRAFKRTHKISKYLFKTNLGGTEQSWGNVEETYFPPSSFLS